MKTALQHCACCVHGLVTLLGDVGEHGLALSRLEALSARLLEECLRLRPATVLVPVGQASVQKSYFFMMFLLRKLLSFCVAGDWISSDGETYFCALLTVSAHVGETSHAILLVILHTRLQHLAVILHALNIGGCLGLHWRVDIAAAENVGRHCWVNVC